MLTLLSERRLPERGSPGVRLLDLGGGYLWMGSQDWRKLAWEWRPASQMVDPILYKCDVFGTACVSCQCQVASVVGELLNQAHGRKSQVDSLRNRIHRLDSHVHNLATEMQGLKGQV
jgi:hypothetical protein